VLLPNHYKFSLCLLALILILPNRSNAIDIDIPQDSIAAYVKSKLNQSARLSRKNANDAVLVTDTLLFHSGLTFNDSISNHIRYRHSLYLLLSDRNLESKKVIHEIIDYYKEFDVKKWAILNIRLGSLEIRLGEYSKARFHIEQAIPYCDSLGLLLNKGIAKVYLADIHLIKSEYGSAFQQADQALTIFRSLDRKDWVASALTDIAYICIRAKDYKAASEYFEQIELIKPQIKKESFLVRPNLFLGILN